MQTLEISATILGLLQGILVLFNKRSNWLFYIAQILCLICFSYLNNLYGDIFNNSVYLFLGILGWFLWKNKDNHQITKCTNKERLTYTLIIILGSTLLFSILNKTKDPLPLLDSFTTTSSLVATYYMVKKKLDTWLIWFVNDILYIIQYSLLDSMAYYLIFLNSVWTIMAIASFFNWSKIMKGEKIWKKYILQANLTKPKKQTLL